MLEVFSKFVQGTVAGVSVAGTIAALAWLGRSVISQFLTAAGDKFRAALKLDEIRHDQTIRATLDFKARQLADFYWPIYIRLQKDNVIWTKILDRNSSDDVLRKVAFEIERNEILPNHEEIVRTIETKIHLSQVDTELQAALMKYVRHIAVYKAMRDSGVTDRDPIALNEPWPKELFPLIERKTKNLQLEYDALLESSGLTTLPQNSS